MYATLMDQFYSVMDNKGLHYSMYMGCPTIQLLLCRRNNKYC